MKLHNLKIKALGIALMALLPAAQAFVIMGQPNAGEVAVWNYTDDLGAPKSLHQQIPRLFRWNHPNFVYSFDASFANYFGPEGMAAVSEAMTVMNDFFDPADGSYNGVTELDLEKHGFAGNYNTTWINTTAQNAQVIDIKSIVLGMMVNHLGLGNPHRHAFSIVGTAPNASSNVLNINVALRNYDPRSGQETDVINGVKYSYRLIHDSAPTIGATPPTFGIADMEEFTTDTSGNSWSSVAAVVDAFYGNTQLFWTETPSLFNFGVYYDSYNAMGGQFQPRHALTYDDAGGLKYLYGKNTYIYEDLDTAGGAVVIEPAQYLPAHMQAILPNPSGRRFPFLPRAGGALGGALPANFSSTSPIAGTPGLAGPVAPTVTALRGGIDKIQFHYRPFDSMLGTVFTPTNFTWSDTFLYEPTNPNQIGISDASGNQVGTINSSAPGIQWSNPFASMDGAQFWQNPVFNYEFKTQKVGRDVTAPDMLFVADYIPVAADGVPVGFTRDVPLGSTAVTSTNYNGAGLTNEIGPGVFLMPGAGFTYTFHKIGGHLENFEVLWSGEASIVGNQDAVPVLWAHIKGPGPNDIETFPKGSTQDRVWNSVIPDTSVPVISLVSDSAGEFPIEADTLTRTEETITIVGTEMASVTAIEIMSGDLVIQTLMPVDKYIVSNSRIDIPAGLITDASEGTERQIRVWNSVGASVASTQKFTIETGRPVITGTSNDGFVFDRAQTLTVTGYGFMSKTVGETVVAHIRIDDANSAAVEDNGTRLATPVSDGVPIPITGIQTISDTQIVLPVDAITAISDGSNRRLRVARALLATPSVGGSSNVDAILSPATNPMFSAITTKPVIGSLRQLDGDLSALWENPLGAAATRTGMYKRDKILEINGTALNTVSTIEIVQEDGTSFANPVFIQLPNAGVSMEDNGTRLMVAANAIPWADADTNETARRAFKIYNAVDNTDLIAAQTFSVNSQPVIDGLGQFAVAGHFNRDKTSGDDLTIFGSGFNSVSQLIITDHNDTTRARVTIELPAPGVTVTDNVISIDTDTFQIGTGADTTIHTPGVLPTDPVGSAKRIIQLTSARDTRNSSMAERFHIGAPPTSLTIAGIAGGNYSRGVDTMTFTGINLALITQLDIVDINGNPIAGVPSLITGTDGTGATGGTGLVVTGTGTGVPAGLSIDANATGWATTVDLLDSATALGRRVKITTPFGSTTTTAATGFRMGAKPEFMSTAAATLAGGGYTADDLLFAGDVNGTYDQSEGDLVINGKNFRSTTSIQLTSVATVVQTFTVDPVNPPAGVTFSADGTKITISSGVINAAWIGIADAGVQVTTIDTLDVDIDKVGTVLPLRGVRTQP